MFSSLSLSLSLFFFHSKPLLLTSRRRDVFLHARCTMQRFRLDYLQHAIRNRDIWTRIGPRSRLNIPVLYTWKGIPLDIAYFCFNNGD